MKVFLFGILTALSTTTFADMATQSERDLLCSKVGEELMNTEIRFDQIRCLNNLNIESNPSNGTTVVYGRLDFDSTNSPEFQKECEISYVGRNIVAGSFSCK